MHKCEAAGRAAVKPSVPAAVNSPGYFQSGTVVDYGILNSIIDEIVNVIEYQGFSLNRTDDTQLFNAVVAGCLSDAVSLAAATTAHTAAVLVSADSAVFGARSLVAASKYGNVSGDCSAVIASDLTGVSTADGVIGDACAAIACDDNSDIISIAGNNSLAMASRDPVIAALFGSLLSTSTSYVDQTLGSVISAGASKNRSNTTSVLMASLHCDSAASTVPPAYSVFGAYHATVDSEPSWRIESNGGHVRGAGTVASGGLDYAEWFENGDGVEALPGRMITRVGKTARLGSAGSRVLGVVSVTPTVVGGDDSLAWGGKWLRDEWGRLLKDETGSNVLNPDYDPARAQHTPREKRPSEWTRVGLVGQMRVAVDETVEEGDIVGCGANGIGTSVPAPNGRTLECMEILSPFDAGRGFAIALCLVG